MKKRKLNLSLQNLKLPIYLNRVDRLFRKQLSNDLKSFLVDHSCLVDCRANLTAPRVYISVFPFYFEGSQKVVTQKSVVTQPGNKFYQTSKEQKLLWIELLICLNHHI